VLRLSGWVFNQSSPTMTRKFVLSLCVFVRAQWDMVEAIINIEDLDIKQVSIKKVSQNLSVLVPKLWLKTTKKV
jgi:hypothetical protein